MRRVPVALLAATLLVACAGDKQEEAAPTTAGPDSVAMALETFNPTAFDTIAWATDTSQTNRGMVVWKFSCEKCHGRGGLGDGGYVLEGDTIKPPSFVQPGWRFATDKQGLLKYIWTGNANGMPHWGIEGLRERDVDAVAAYIQKVIAAAAAAAQPAAEPQAPTQ